MDYFQNIGEQWRKRAGELAEWTLMRLVNRTDVWGRYLPQRSRERADRDVNQAITAPFRDERGKVFLGISSLEKHYRTRDVGGVLGIHSASSDLTSR